VQSIWLYPSKKEVLVDSFTLVDLLGYFPKTATELSGIASMLCHFVGFYLYGTHVLKGETKPNIATWGMWFFGEVVDLITYDSIEGSHWTTNAGPLACTVGVLVISILIMFQHVRLRLHGRKVEYQPLNAADKFWAIPDITAFMLWLAGKGTIGNFISVGTTVVQYIPMYRETYRNPQVEQVGPWIWWSAAYLFTLLAVVTGPGAANPALYFLPIYYFLIDGVMVWLCLRKVPGLKKTATA
jgi:hypothetical protein